MESYEKYKDDVHRAILIRKTEEKLLDLYSFGKLSGTIHTCLGQEFVGVSVGRNIRSYDNIVSNHRCHGHFLSYKCNTIGLIGEIMGDIDTIITIVVAILAVLGNLTAVQRMYHFWNEVKDE